MGLLRQLHPGRDNHVTSPCIWLLQVIWDMLRTGASDAVDNFLGNASLKVEGYSVEGCRRTECTRALGAVAGSQTFMVAQKNSSPRIRKPNVCSGAENLSAIQSDP